MSGNSSRTPRRATVKSRDRVDMGLTVTASKKRGRLLISDDLPPTSMASNTDIADILQINAATASSAFDDKENSSEDINIVAVTGHDVYGFQKSTRGRTRGTRGRTRGGGVRGAHQKTKGRAAINSNDSDEESSENEEPRAQPNEHSNDEDDGDVGEDLDDFSRTAEPAYERYFQDLHTTRGSKTSDNTLAKLPQLPQSEYRRIISAVPPKHKAELELLHDLHRSQFKQWEFELSCGFNILFYGYGSKRQLLNRFATTALSDAPVVIINGYFPTLSLKPTLEKIVSEVVGFSDTSGSIADLTVLISEYFNSDKREVDHMTLVIHNIDGQCLRKHQAALAALVSCDNIRLLASIDHIEAPLIWDSSTVTKFNWVWHDLTTFEHYSVETSYENFATDSAEVGPRGVLHVLASLTENARSIFRILAEHQIAESVMDDGDSGEQQRSGVKSQGMLYTSYFAACRDQFLVSSDMAFRSQLTEFRDHKVFQSKYAPDGSESVYIPLDANTLGSILENME